jgi:hypothetical protein
MEPVVSWESIQAEGDPVVGLRVGACAIQTSLPIYIPLSMDKAPVVDEVMKLASPLEVEVMEVLVLGASVVVCQALFMGMI